ncbi:DNA polymerase III subunit beta [Aureimonas ureilytica]|uniref:DNA polymerase III subunit beta n=1 Tax=Aureimonas ureilytica TaxID=401562 RepID=UPI00037F1DFA|nr:DNA polymerase III subunit beta [Aureimonas ureilytica]
MRISLPQADLVRALSAVTRVVEARNTIPILSNVLLSVADSRMTVKGSDLTIEASSSVSVLDAVDGAVTVEAKVLADIAKRASGDVSLVLEDEALVVKFGRSRFKLKTLPAEDFPDISAGSFEHTFEIDLASLLSQVEFAQSSEETRYYLNGVYFHTYDDHIVVVATDGHRLARFVGPESQPFDGVILPRKLVSIVPKGKIKVELSNDRIRLTDNASTITSKLIDGTFPDYRRVVPMENDLKVVVDRDALAAATDRVAIVQPDKGKGVRLVADNDNLKVSYRDDASEDVAASWDGTEPLEIGVNGSYLSTAVRVFSSGKVTLEVRDQMSPIRITGQTDGLDMVLMPMRAV